MKKCPYCAEEIQDEAIKCKHCGEFLNQPVHMSPQAVDQNVRVPWYFRTSTIVTAILCVGPLALPLIWVHPVMTRSKKIIYTLIILAITYFLGVAFSHELKKLREYYDLIFSAL